MDKCIHHLSIALSDKLSDPQNIPKDINILNIGIRRRKKYICSLFCTLSKEHMLFLFQFVPVFMVDKRLYFVPLQLQGKLLEKFARQKQAFANSMLQLED